MLVAIEAGWPGLSPTRRSAPYRYHQKDRILSHHSGYFIQRGWNIEDGVSHDVQVRVEEIKFRPGDSQSVFLTTVELSGLRTSLTTLVEAPL